MTSDAFGKPGIEPRWTRSDKDAVLTAYSTSSPIWATISAGIINELYFPTIDTPQVRDLQFLLTDGKTFFHDERRGTDSTIEQLCEHSLGFRVTNRDHEGRYTITKRIITAPHAACLLIRTRVTVAREWQGKIQLFALLAPHLEVGGRNNTGQVVHNRDRLLLTANKGNSFLAMDCSCGFRRGSCGYVGASDGWTDLADNRQMDWCFTQAVDGNIALMGEIAYEEAVEFTLAIGFGYQSHSAIVATAQSLAIPFDELLARFDRQWSLACRHRDDRLAAHALDDGKLFRMSFNLFLAHEDKTYQGATIASLSIPWGQAKTDEDLGGYHLVWPRDLVNTVTGMLAAGETETPLRALIYLACVQREDGGFYQNFWIDGREYWDAIQLDEVAYPIILAWRLQQAGVLQLFDPYSMVRAAAIYLVTEGPATQQERWENSSGFSPSTLAVHIAALVCAAAMANERSEKNLATYLLEYADFLEQHLERWTVTRSGTLLDGVPRHYIRLFPVDTSQNLRPENLGGVEATITSLPEDVRNRFPASDIVDAGFLELVRYGVRPAGDPLIEDSLKVVDHVLKVDTPKGPSWRRYNHDGYGQRSDGGPYHGFGQGRAWPLLTGERGHYELACGRDCLEHLRAMEAFAGPMGLLPEQVWDEADNPAAHAKLGQATGSAMPLMWAHAEYVKLLRSLHDGRIFDRIDIVSERYGSASPDTRKQWEIWKFTSQPGSVCRSTTLRIQARAPFRLRWSPDQWESSADIASRRVAESVHYVDLAPEVRSGEQVHFTFWWTDEQRWEGRDFTLANHRDTLCDRP